MQPAQAIDWSYAPAPETFPVEIQAEHGLFIGGRFVDPRSRKHFETENPATERRLSKVAEAGKADVDAAVKAATKAFKPCRARRVPLPHRAPDPGARTRTRRARVDGQRQAHQGNA
jgi:hypothetical protein